MNKHMGMVDGDNSKDMAYTAIAGSEIGEDSHIHVKMGMMLYSFHGQVLLIVTAKVSSFQFDSIKHLAAVGFEPTPPKRLVP